MVAGTSSTRTTAASTMSATTMPTPSSFRNVMLEAENEPDDDDQQQREARDQAAGALQAAGHCDRVVAGPSYRSLMRDSMNTS